MHLRRVSDVYKRQVQAHDGTVWVEDGAPGARFVVELPLVVADEAGTERSGPPVGATTARRVRAH